MEYKDCDWIKKIPKWEKFEIIEGHVTKDHVYLIFSIPPKFVVSDKRRYGKKEVKEIQTNQQEFGWQSQL